MSRRTPTAREVVRSKIGHEFVFRMIEDLAQLSTSGTGAVKLYDAEFMFFAEDEYQGRDDLTDATEKCIVEVGDYGRHAFMAWEGMFGRARWRSVDVTEDGETLQQAVGEIVSVQHVGPIFWAELDGAMSTGGTATVETSIAGETREVDVTDYLDYIPTTLADEAVIRFFWNFDRRGFELLDCKECPSSS